MTNKSQVPQNWPQDIEYISFPRHSPNLTSEQFQILRTIPRLHSPSDTPIIHLPLSTSSSLTQRIIIVPIIDKSHPACGQLGLFAARDLAPDSLIVPYLGYIHSSDPDDTNPLSDYDLSLDREAGLGVDAKYMGNEGRCVNDFRGVPRPGFVPSRKGEKVGPNAEFRDVWFEYRDGDGHGGASGGEKGIGIFVLSAGKSGRRKVGIKKGEEVLVSYGKGFWSNRMTDQDGGQGVNG